jgi:hypothetical protein
MKRRKQNMIAVIKNFKEVIETRNIDKMNKELYEFLHLHGGFIAHYDINGFKATYKSPRDFAEVFIRHFDRQHRYYQGIYAYHQEPYKETGLTKAEIKKEFGRIVDQHKDQISQGAKEEQTNERYALYLKLKQEFEGGETHEHRI